MLKGSYKGFLMGSNGKLNSQLTIKLLNQKIINVVHSVPCEQIGLHNENRLEGAVGRPLYPLFHFLCAILLTDYPSRCEGEALNEKTVLSK